MARKKKLKPFRAVSAVKAIARERIGEPRPSAVASNRKKDPARHKKTLGQLLQEE